MLICFNFYINAIRHFSDFHVNGQEFMIKKMKA